MPEEQKPAEAAPAPEGRCADVAVQVTKFLAGNARRQNQMVRTEPEQRDFNCSPLPIPEMSPWTTISWGDSRCDCIEGDDVEIMYVTVCNPYSNVTLSGLTVERLVVVTAHEKPVPKLPNGTPCIELVPVGPYCFGDIEPCSCATRQFLVRLRGAPGGQYKILLEGVCFEACVHGDTHAKFVFDVCPD